MTGSRRRLVACAALIAVLSGSDAAAAPTQSHAFQFALQNGMQVVVIPDHRAPVVTQMIWFKVGAADDPPGLSGMAHFFEHMMFRGTKVLPGDGFSETVARDGGEDNAFTTHDATCFYEQIARDKLKTIMALDADRIANLDLSYSNVATEREIVLEERRMRIDNDPQALVDEQMEAALHLSHPYGRPVIGWPDEVRRIGRVEAQNFYDHHYAPNNAILIEAGDVTAEEVRTDALATFGKVPAREIVPRWEFAQPPRLGETRLSIANADAKVPTLSRVYRVVSYAEAGPGQAESLDVLAQLLGGGASSMLYKTLVVERKLATDAGASYDGMRRDAGEFSVYAVPRPGVSLPALERAVDEIIGRVQTTPAAPGDLARAKTQLVASTIYRRDNQYAMASAYGQALMIGLTLDDVDAWPSRIRNVNGAGVRKVANSALVRKEAVTAYLVPLGRK